MRALLFAAILLGDAPSHPWAGYLAGTWVRFELRREPEEKGGPAGQKVTVVKSGPEGVLLRTEMLGPAGEVLFQEETRHAPAPPPARREAGKETLRIDGRDFACTIFESKGAKTRARVWLSPELPGVVLKAEEEGEDRRSATTLLRLREPRRAGAHEFPCRILERVETGKDRPTVTTRTWECPLVPGLVVREEVRTDAKGRPRLTVRELVDLEVRQVSRAGGGR